MFQNQLGTLFQSCQDGGTAKDGPSRDRIVEVAVELLDADGEDGPTFRALAGVDLALAGIRRSGGP